MLRKRYDLKRVVALMATVSVVAMIGCSNGEDAKDNSKITTTVDVERTTEEMETLTTVEESSTTQVEPSTEETTTTQEVTTTQPPTTTQEVTTTQKKTEPPTTTEVPTTTKEETTKHSHAFSKKIINPTCTENGYTTYTCSCGEKYDDDYTSAKGHTEVIDKAVEATCTAIGLTEGKHCSVCNVVLIEQQTIKSNGHNYEDWIIDNSANCDTDGTMHRKCYNCSYKETKTIPKLGHNKNTLVSVEDINNTFFGNWTCDRCNSNFREKYEPISATFSKSIDISNYPKYGLYVNATGGVGSYEYQYVVYNKITGQVLGAVYTEDNGISFTDYSNFAVYENTLAVRVYIIDDVGEIAYDVNLNDGDFSSAGVRLYYSYQLNGGSFSGVDFSSQ